MADKDRDYDEGEALDPELLYSKETCIGMSLGSCAPPASL